MGAFSQIKETSISGFVYDAETFEDLQYAEVVIYQKDKLIAGTLTERDGFFNIAAAPGTYKLVVSYIGCWPYEISHIELKSGSTAIDIPIKSGIDLYPITITALGIKHDNIGCVDYGWLSCMMTDLVQAQKTSSDEQPNDPTEFIQAFPNPTLNSVIIKSNTLENAQHLMLINQQGKKLSLIEVQGEYTSIDLSNQQSGFYYVSIIDSEQKHQTIPIVKLE